MGSGVGRALLLILVTTGIQLSCRRLAFTKYKLYKQTRQIGL
jgi:hypothetical protein